MTDHKKHFEELSAPFTDEEWEFEKHRAIPNGEQDCFGLDFNSEDTICTIICKARVHCFKKKEGGLNEKAS